MKQKKIVSMIGMLVVLIGTMFMMTGCPDTVSGESGKTKITPVAHGKAIITLDPADKTIKVRVKTSDGTPITVEGADKTSIESGELTDLTATGTQIVLKNGKITLLYYFENRITAIDVQELSELQSLWCSSSQLKNLNVKNLTKLRWLYCDLNNLDASAFTAILDALPKRLPSDDAVCRLFQSIFYEKNYQFTAPVPEKLKKAFYKAKKNNWAIKKFVMTDEQDIVLSQDEDAVPVTGVTLDNTALSLIEGEKGKLTATVAPVNATNKTVSWASNKPEIASVDQNGNLTANKDGEAEITVTTQDGSFTAKCTVTIESAVKKAVLTLSPYEKDIKLTAKTKDGTPITVEGCNVTSLLSGTETTLNAIGEQIILKGDITELLCSENDLTAIDVSCLTSLKKLECQKNEFTELNVSGCVSLQELDCHENRMLRNLNLQGCVSLQKLDCSSIRLTELNLQSFTSLQELNCSNNSLTKLDVSGLSSLQKLNCCYNNLIELNVQGCLSLRELDCSSNRDNLAKLDVSGLTSLQKLDCCYNKLSELNIQGCNALQELNCNENILRGIIANGLTFLQKLYCKKNWLTGITVQGCTALEELDCDENKNLEVLNAKGCSSLQRLRCTKGALTKLNVQGCASLQWLDCYGNKLDKEAFTKIFADLPDRNGKTKGSCCLYSENVYDYDGNYKYFTDEELNVIKNKNWSPYKINDTGYNEEL